MMTDHDPSDYPFCPYCDESLNQLIGLCGDWDGELFECEETGERYSVREAFEHIPEHLVDD